MQPQTQTQSSNDIKAFKSSIVRIRDILRGPGVAITGMESMRHICLYILARYVDIEKAQSLGVPANFAWENLIHVSQTQEGGVQFAFDLFYHKEEDCLIAHFDRLFGTEKFSFDIKSPMKHKEIMEIMHRIDVRIIDDHIDLLGWVYEQHLGTGASGSGSRDLGQYFTHRAICEYLVDLCKPGFEEHGIPESICDPTMGTGGFLTTFIKYYRRAHPDNPVDWKIQCKEIHGCDTDPKVAGIARANLFMETGGYRAQNLLTHDSLYNDLPQSGYKIILANMPFGVKQLVHADCCERVKDLKIRTTKSEPLFLQLMMVSLKPGGRCAVVVPDGILFNVARGHRDTRKYLLDHFELKRIIKMKGQFFTNTSIQPSILFFENTGKSTTAVEFWDVVKDVTTGDIQETMILSVPTERLNDDFSFNMNYYQEKKALVPNTGFPQYPLSEISNYANGRTLSSAEKTDDGEYDVMGGGMTYNGKTNAFNREGETISISKSGSAGFVCYHNKKYWAGDCLTITPRNVDDVITKYLYYYLKLTKSTTTVVGSTIPHCKWDDIKDISVVVPPLHVQNEIVATLDRIYMSTSTAVTEETTISMTETLKMTDKGMDLILANPAGEFLEPIIEARRLIRRSDQMIAHIKLQMGSVISASMHGPECTEYLLSELAEDNPENLTRSDTGYETINYVDLGSVKEGKISAVQSIPVSEKPARAQRKIQDGDVIWGSVRPLSRSYAFIETAAEHMVGSTGFVVIRTKDATQVTSKYLYYTLTTDACVRYLDMHSTGSSYPAFNSQTIMAYRVTIPPMHVQTKTLERLSALQLQLDALETLKQQSEDNAKFILESYSHTT